MNTASNPRAGLYALLARLMLSEIDAAMVLHLHELPVLAEHIPASADIEDWLIDLRTEYHRLFHLNINPYESIFRDQRLMHNTAVTQRVVTFYKTCSFIPNSQPPTVAPDHLGIELSLAARLAMHEPQSVLARSRLASLLHEHLAAWAPICCEAIARTTRAPLYRTLAQVISELVLYDLAEFTPVPLYPRVHFIPSLDEPSPPLPAARRSDSRHMPQSLEYDRDDSNYDLHQIIHQLLTPSVVGIFISRADIAGIGHAFGMRAPVARRERMLMNLFQMAASFDCVPILLKAFGTLLSNADDLYAELIDAHPTWGLHGHTWRARIAEGMGLIEQLKLNYRALQLK